MVSFEVEGGRFVELVRSQSSQGSTGFHRDSPRYSVLHSELCDRTNSNKPPLPQLIEIVLNLYNKTPSEIQPLY